jgi:RHS repeat-associated protein
MPTLKIIPAKCMRLLWILLVMSLSIAGAFGQTTSQFDHSTPAQLAAGVSSLGSYTSADVGTINLSNGALNIKLPLASVGGRGFSVPLALNYSSKVWSASRNSDFEDENGPHPIAYANYGDIENLIDLYSRITPGWTVGAAPTLLMRGNGIKNNTVTTCNNDWRFALTTLTVILPDKGEIQLRDDAKDGAPLTAQLDEFNCTTRDGNRGQRWHATDGSGAVFISDTANGIVRGDLNGVLILSDGTRYRFAGLFTPPAGSPPIALVTSVKHLARATSITDRNGNVITITYPTSNEVRYTDQLGRVTKIQKSVPDPDNPSVNLALLVTVPGYQGQNRYIKIKTAIMNQRYRPGINPTLPVINGDYDPLGWGLSWGTATRLFPLSHGLGALRIDQATILSEFVLPDGRVMEFFYNEYGEVAEVRLPTGGKLQYDYQYTSSLPAGKSHIGEVTTSVFHSDVSDIERSVVARRTYADGATLEGSWAYTYTSSTALVTASSASGSVLLKQKHYFLASGEYLNSPAGTGPVPDRGVEGTGYLLWSTGIERRTESLDAAGTTVIGANEQDWTQRTSLNWSAHTTYAQEQPQNDNRVNEERNILDTLQTARTTFLYDLFNNPTQTSEFDFDGTLKRSTVTSYSSTNLVNGVNYADDSIRLIRLPLQQSTYDGASVEQARTVGEYDIYVNDGDRAAMQAYSPVSGHDSANYGVSRTARGNATRIGRWIKSTNTFVYAYPRYDMLGNVVSSKDPRGFVTTVSFADDFGDGSSPGSGTNNPATPTYALPTLITSPDPGNGSGPHTARSQYDLSTGLLTGFKDRNNVITQTIYNDPFNRPTLTKAALLTGVQTNTAMFYAPATAFGITLTRNDVLTAKDRDTLGDAVLRSWTVTDGFGRTKEAWSRDPQGDVKVITNYDGLGRTSQTSNPFRPSLGETAVYTTTVYDLAGRTTSITTPDNSVGTTSYSGNTVTVTDQTGKKRKSVTDALGRLKEVYEDPLGVNYQTTYSYDVLDNLTGVTQGTQTRTFVYDSLKRLTSATNPESGTLSYQYDNNGNLTQKTDARGFVSVYVYDPLNRNTTIDYSDTSGINPDITRAYDTATNGKGRLRESYAGGNETTGATVEHTKIVSYDALGRPLDQRQRFKTTSVWSTEFQIQRGYNIAGSVTSQTYPSGRTANYAYDIAAGVTTFTGTLGDGVNRNYSTEVLYSPFGGRSKEKFGTDIPIFNKSFYNSRGQLSEIRVGTTYTGPTDTGWQRGAIINHYSSQCWGACNGTDNNGNVKQQDHWIPDSSGGVQAVFTQSFAYDNLNRLLRANEGSNWQQEFVYDRWGNRTIHQTNTWGTGINKKDFTVDTANNRLGVPVGQSGAMTYDAAGNLTNDTYTGAGSRMYDAENRMTKAWGGNNQWQEYTYNSYGMRVRRKIDGVETWQIYGMDGELLAEYPANGATASPQKEYGYRNGQLLVTAEPTQALFVVGSTTLNAGDAALKARLEGMGLTVTVKDAPSAVTADAIGKVLVLISGTVVSGDVGVKFRDVTVPVIVLEPLLFDDMKMTGTAQGTDYDVLNSQTQVSIFTPGHPLAAGLTGTVTVNTSPIIFSWGNPSTGAIKAATLVGNPGRATSFGYAGGTSMVGMNAPARRVGLFILNDNATSLTADGWKLFDAAVGWAGSWGVRWLVSDQLGTPRIVIDKTGSLTGVKRHDYLPFGEELFAGIGGRTIGLGYTSDTIRQQFTSKERDVETGLDYFGARYYASTHGRFTSPDEPFADQSEGDPQTWNLYSYTSNNPLARVDLDGKRWFYKNIYDKNGKLINRDVQWVNPNDDGSYTSPGEGWVEFIPTSEKPKLFTCSDGTWRACNQVAELGENSDGSPNVRLLWTGRVEDKPEHIIMAVDLARSILNVVRGAVSSFVAWRAAKAEEAAIQQILKNYHPNSELGRRVKDVLENGGRERLSTIEREAAARWYEQTAKRVKGSLQEAARKLNMERARYLREGGPLPGKIHKYK